MGVGKTDFGYVSESRNREKGFTKEKIVKYRYGIVINIGKFLRQSEKVF